jgi:putative endopeptidase
MDKTLLAFGAFVLVSSITTLAAQPSATKPTLGSWGIDLSGMDTSLKPGDDFFLYANGKWLATAEIPADRASAGSFQNLQILSEQRMKDIVGKLATKPYNRLSAEEKQLRSFYDAFVDVDQIEKRGLAPVQKDLNWIASLKTPADIAAAMGNPGRGTDSLFSSHIQPDAKNSNAYVMSLYQSGLGLPERDYYLRNEPNLATTREAYQHFLSTMLTLSGAKNAETRAAAVFDLETRIAKVSWPVAERREADKTYNPMSITSLQKLAPGFPWAVFFAAQGLPAQSPSGERMVIVGEKTAFPALAKIFADTPIAVWRDWLTTHYLHAMSAYLPQRFDEANFAFYGKILGGQQQQLDRSTRGVHQLNGRLGHPFGKLYVARYFPPASKAKVDKLIANLLKAYDANIHQIPWMTEVTRQKALEKLHTFKPHVGYPEKWRDYSGLVIDKNDLIRTIHRSDLFEWHYRLDRIDQPTDRNEWEMTPQTVNAYYTENFNSIFFPAAILQAPFFDPNADDAVNYGGIGAVIGHEISHGFDDQGSKYDGAGLLHSWWTDEDRKAFDQRTANLVAQFNTFEALPGLRVNGKLTLGENIGDLSGVGIALKAYHLSGEGKQPKVLDGFNGDQRFFLGFAQVWRGKYRDSEMRKLILSNPHSPPHFRVIGPMRNIDEWYTAFDVKPSDKDYIAPDQRVRLW